MVNRHNVPALLLALVGVMSLISCSTTDTVSSTVSASETSVPRIVTVLQAEDWGFIEGAVAFIKSYAAELDLEVQIERIRIRTMTDVRKHRFLGSPTIQIDGLDIDPSARSRTQYGFAWRLLDWTQGASATKAMLYSAFREAGWVSGEDSLESQGLLERLRLK